ncbi:hypothetical protein AXG93_3911s1120 [Marchantia polymorpha subsp. ruderalis]|uniref:non-specific serine/threonine protein kinase n=1 Tax=Marchantia polymorpha subsp. ruderalis TaxID=1480154 RepID=A0A176W319_MARPO|nr:hypothetical protein AXG93_3911s1120 [Marchantia polymorpha subsp. ruderalis]
MDIPGLHDMDRYELVRDIGSGNFGVARLMRDKKTRELVAVKYIERGEKVMVTPTHLAIVMEYAAGGELFERICNAGRFSEDEARFFFQQLISGVSYCHSMQICHRDLKLENTLLDGSPAPRLKICDFGYSKVLHSRPLSQQRCPIPFQNVFVPSRSAASSLFRCGANTVSTWVFAFRDEQSSILHSQPKSTVGTPAYIAPEVLSKKEYDGKIADVWSCGVTLYVMLVGAYPFEDPEDPRNFRKTIGRILSVQYTIPDYVHISNECRQLLKQIFVANPAKRISISEIKNHEWFLKNLPADLIDGSNLSYVFEDPNHPPQSIEEIHRIINEARTCGAGSGMGSFLGDSGLDGDDMDLENDADPDVDSSGEFVCTM